MENLFFELIQVAIGTRDCLTRQPSTEEWYALFEMAKKQSLVGICFVGVQKLYNANPNHSNSSNCSDLSKLLYLTWMGLAAKIQQRNDIVSKQCVELQRLLTKAGIQSSILKGQAIGTYYGELSRLRQSGDIDVYVNCGRKNAIEFAKQIGDSNPEWDYKHLHLKVFSDTEVEVHYVPEVSLNLIKNYRLQKWFAEQKVQRSLFQETGEMVTPSAEFNLFYILLHTYRHFLYEGVGLRQLMDYYWTLSNSPFKGEDLNRLDAVVAIQDFGMDRFARGVMWIMKEVFGLDDEHLLCEPNEKEGRYILYQVMMGGNFGHHDERLQTKKKSKSNSIMNVLKHNAHILIHYPADTLWAPVWIVYHWIWKRFLA